MNKNLLISVIIPCYNCESTIERAVKSVFNQSYKNWELILVDNNSTDSSYLKLLEIKESFPDRIKVLTESKKGASAARNKGMHEAKGDWLQFLDADDEIVSNKFEYSISKINNHPDITIIVGEAEGMSAKGATIRKVDEDVWLGLINSRLGITSANLFQKNAVMKIGGWDETKTSSQEYNLMFSLLRDNNKVYISKEILARIHYDNSQSVSRDKSPDKILSIVDNSIELRLRIYQYLKEKNILNSKYKNAVSKSIRNSLIYFLPFSKKNIIIRIFKLIDRLTLRDILIILYMLPSSLIKNKR